MTSLTLAESRIAPSDAAMTLYLQSDRRARRALLRDANAAWMAHRATFGYVTMGDLLTDPEDQPKLRKSVAPTFGLALVPASISGVNLCPASTMGCRVACLFTSGKGGMSSVQRSRLCRTMFALTDPHSFGVRLAHEVLRAMDAHGSIKLRLNIETDIRWERVLPTAVPMLVDMGVVLYDYTKWAPSLRDDRYIHLTWSASERHDDAALQAMLAAGHSVAIVFSASKDAVKRAVAEGQTWNGFPMVDGLSSDDRSLDPRGVVVALAALGAATRDESGFVRPFVLDDASEEVAA